MNQLNVQDDILDGIRKIANEFEDIECIKLFGSRVRGDHSQTSDIDLAIFGQNIDEGNFAYELETRLLTLLEFDTSFMNGIEDRGFIEQVEKEGIIIYEKSRF